MHVWFLKNITVKKEKTMENSLIEEKIMKIRRNAKSKKMNTDEEEKELNNLFTECIKEIYSSLDKETEMRRKRGLVFVFLKSILIKTLELGDEDIAIDYETKLIDLGVDSINGFELSVSIDLIFNIKTGDDFEVKTVDNAINYIIKKL
jgi:acyl carrier protein